MRKKGDEMIGNYFLNRAIAVHVVSHLYIGNGIQSVSFFINTKLNTSEA